MKITLAERRLDAAGGIRAGDPPPSRLWFWVLVLFASAMFAPCVLVPVWKDYQAIKLAERFEISTVEAMRGDIARQERTLDALRTDPGAVARVAQRELAYTRRGASSVRVTIDPTPSRLRPNSIVAPVQPPVAVTRALSWISLKPTHLEVFADPELRTTVICLSGGLIVAACLIFPPRRRLNVSS